MKTSPAPPVADDLGRALDALKEKDPTDFLRELPGVGRVGRLLTFNADEAAALQGALAVTRRYLAQGWPPRPLCLAVFGPPGSGKSFAVKEIRAKLEEEQRAQPEDQRLRLPHSTFNLTQLPSREALAEALARVAGERARQDVPFVFFDEFDAALGGAELGWLAWFLAPMEDGAFVHRGAPVKLDRAVYVFAGGTASTFAAFAHPPVERLARFKMAKGPDFVSRLRLTLDVAGPNTEPRALRRAPILAELLKKTGVTLAPTLARSLLGAARYRHGSRSIGAVLDVSDLATARADGKGVLDFHHLPAATALLDLHVDRGPLDPARLGGRHLTMSGGGAPDGPTTKCWEHLAGRLFQLGATLGYGGKDEVGLTRQLTNVVRALEAPVAHPSAGGQPPRLVLRPPAHTRIGVDDPGPFVHREPAPGLSPEERASLPEGALGTWWERVLCLFRMRLLLAEGAVGCVALGGGPPNPSKRRMAGVAEEILLHLALGRPVYVVGGFGPSAARDAGTLLGLAQPWPGVPSGLLAALSEPARAHLAREGGRLRPPVPAGLPVTDDEVLEFFGRHAVGTAGWPENGLSVEENRTLFASTDEARIAELIEKGLTAVAEAGG